MPVNRNIWQNFKKIIFYWCPSAGFLHNINVRIWNIEIIRIALHYLTSHNCSQCIVHWASNYDGSCYISRVCASDPPNQEHLIYLEVNGYIANTDKSRNKHEIKIKEGCCICDVSLRRSFHLKCLPHNNDFTLQALLRVQVKRYAQKVFDKVTALGWYSQSRYVRQALLKFSTPHYT